MIKWEYRVVVVKFDAGLFSKDVPEKWTEALNEWGRDGWELAAVEQGAHIFKRRLA